MDPQNNEMIRLKATSLGTFNIQKIIFENAWLGDNYIYGCFECKIAHLIAQLLNQQVVEYTSLIQSIFC